MRRKDRAVTNLDEIAAILALCKTCHLAMNDNGMPYVVPLSFGSEFNNGIITLYFHSAYEGRKIDILRRNNAVCFEMCDEGEPFSIGTPCNSGYYYSSLIGFGKAVFVTDPTEKCRALTCLMRQQSDAAVAFTPAQAETVCVFKVVTSDFTGKHKPKQPSVDQIGTD